MDDFKLMVMEQRIGRMREALEELAKDPAMTPVLRILREDTELSLRRTGRTTKALLAALERAKAGEVLRYVVHAPAMVDECMRLIGKHGDVGAAVIQRSCITFARGSLEVSAQAPARGSGASAVYDHAEVMR